MRKNIYKKAGFEVLELISWVKIILAKTED
jgi:hypothetical protein